MAEITRILAANIYRQFFFLSTTTQRVLAAWLKIFTLSAVSECHVTITDVQNVQNVQNGQNVQCSKCSKCSKWPNDRMVAVVKHCWLLVQGKRGCGER